MNLTTMLLVDAVEKSGPGSGPQGGKGGSSRQRASGEAFKASRNAESKGTASAHLEAQAAHEVASRRNSAAGYDGSAYDHKVYAGYHAGQARALGQK